MGTMFSLMVTLKCRQRFKAIEMGQYTVANYLFEHGPSTKGEIAAGTEDSSPSVAQSLTELKRRELVQRVGEQYEFHSDATREDLERIRPRTLSELMDE